jgi:transposase-like protein
MDSPAAQLFHHFSKDNILAYLQVRNLLPTHKQCACGHQMNIQCYSRSEDGFIFRCCKCKKTKNLREGTFFGASQKLTVRKVMEIAFYWLIEVPVSTAAELVGVTHTTAIQWYQYCRDICSNKMVGLQQQLGGPGHIVEIDESLIFKRKYNVGHRVEQQWLFGLYDIHLRKGYCIHVEVSEHLKNASFYV